MKASMLELLYGFDLKRCHLSSNPLCSVIRKYRKKEQEEVQPMLDSLAGWNMYTGAPGAGHSL